MIYDVAIVGGGPAGLSAAIEAASRGVKVVVIDDHPDVGGKLNGQLHEEPGKQGWWIGKDISKKLKDKVLSLGVTILSGSQVWSLEQGWKIFISKIDGSPVSKKMIRAKTLLLATGAVEKPLPLPGWTLPGVLTIGGAQVLTNQYNIKPGNRVLVVGIDILSLSIARAMKLAGAEVVGIYMAPKNEFTNEVSNPKKLLQLFQPMAKFAPNMLMKLGGNLLKSESGRSLAVKFYPKSGMDVWEIPLHIRRSILKIQGENEVGSVLLTNIDEDGNPVGKPFEEEVDAVCISGGLTPQYELAVLAGCQFVRLHGLSGVVPLHDCYMNTTVEGLFVAGNITGIEGAKVSAAQGKLAGKSICCYLGIGSISKSDLDNEVSSVETVRKTADVFFHPDIISARRKLQELWEESVKKVLI